MMVDNEQKLDVTTWLFVILKSKKGSFSAFLQLKVEDGHASYFEHVMTCLQNSPIEISLIVLWLAARWHS